METARILSMSYLFGMIDSFRKAVVGDWRFEYLSGSNLQSQVKGPWQVMVLMPLVVV